MKRIFLCLTLLAGLPALAQHAHHGAHTPYAGMQQRTIKALSEQQIADLRAGRGMSLALAAELNGYPGPLHVLELADALALRAQQKTRTAALFEQMQAEARALGETVIEKEGALDRLFARGGAQWPQVQQAVMQAGQAQAALRAAHLKYHLLMLDVLDREQVERYAVLRGYRRPG